MRGNSSVNWSEYTASRSYTATGMTTVQVDGRNNATSIHSDLAGRTLNVTDAANSTTTTTYDTNHDQPAVVTDAMGNTACYKYDARGRKIAEWGTAIQPACFGYDDMDNMTTLRTFRAESEDITTDPSERPDYDQTTWVFNAVTGLEMTKTYADNTSVVKTYDVYNRLATETDARGNVKTHTYEHARGLHLGTSYTVVEGTAETTARSFTYNHLGLICSQFPFVWSGFPASIFFLDLLPPHSYFVPTPWGLYLAEQTLSCLANPSNSRGFILHV